MRTVIIPWSALPNPRRKLSENVHTPSPRDTQDVSPAEADNSTFIDDCFIRDKFIPSCTLEHKIRINI